MGDYFDRRKYVNFASLQRNIEHFVKPMQERGITMDLILGNHDTYYKNTNKVNSPALVLYDQKGINVFEDPLVKNYDGLDVALVPWINNENYADNIEFFQTAPAPICFGHFEIEGAMLNPAMVCSHGLPASYLKRFEKVYSGHFHHKSDIENIRYVGSQMQFTWSDYGDEKFFHVFDTDTRELEFIPNPNKLFFKLFYDDTDMSYEDLDTLNYTTIANKYVKVVIKSKENPLLFDSYISRLEEQEPINLQVVEDHLNLDLEDDDDIIDEAEDTLTILDGYIEGLDIKTGKPQLKSLMHNLYNEALSII